MNVLFLLMAAFVAMMTCGQTNGGCIDIQRCISVLPEYSVEQSIMTARAAELDDTLKTLVSEYQRFLMHGLPHGSRVDSLAMAKATIETGAREAAIEKFGERARAELLDIEDQSLGRLRQIVIHYLGKYCEEKGLSLIIECDALLFGSGCSDHTDGFIEFLGRRR